MKDANEQQRLAFSLRLNDEFSRLNLPINSPTQIAREFSQRFPDQAVTAQTVRKWLLGEAIPVQAKLLALAAWFGISAQWLRYGTGVREDELATTSPRNVPAQIRPEVASATVLLSRLSMRDLGIIEGLMRLMLESTQASRED